MDVRSIFDAGGTVIKNPNYSKSKKNTQPEFITVSDLNQDIAPTGSFVASMAYDAAARGQQDIIGRNGELDKYTKHGITPNQIDNLDLLLADAQSNWTKAGNALAQTLVSEVVLGSIRGFSDLADFIATNIFRVKNNEDYSNPVSQVLEKAQEDFRNFAPIYRDESKNIANGGLGDFGWWASNFPSIFSSITLLLPSAGIVGGLSRIGKATKIGALTRNGLRTAVKLDKAIEDGKKLNAVQRFLNTDKYIEGSNLLIKNGATAALSRTMENYQEARDTYKDMYTQISDDFTKMKDEEYNAIESRNNHLLEKYGIASGDRDGLAKAIAKESADATFKLDYANLVFDVIELYGLKDFWKGLRNAPGSSRAIRKAEREARRFEGWSAEKIAEFEKNRKWYQKAGEYVGDLAVGSKAAVAGQLSEGIEEGVNYIAQQEGTTFGKALISGETDEKDYSFWKNVVSGFDGRINDYFNDPYLYDSAFWGVLGGVVFQGLGGYAGRLRNHIEGKSEANKESQEENLPWYSLRQMPAVRARIAEIKGRTEKRQRYLDALDKINNGEDPFNSTENNKVTLDTEEERQAARDLVKQHYINDLTLSAMAVGNLNSLKAYLQDENVRNSFIEAGLFDDANNATKSLSEKQAEATTYINSAIAQMDKIESMYDEELSAVGHAAYNIPTKNKLLGYIPAEYLQQIAVKNVRIRLGLEHGERQLADVNSRIGQVIANLTDEQKELLDPDLNYDAAKRASIFSTRLGVLYADKRYLTEKKNKTLSDQIALNTINRNIKSLEKQLDNDELVFATFNALSWIRDDKGIYTQASNINDEKEKQVLAEAHAYLIRQIEDYEKNTPGKSIDIKGIEHLNLSEKALTALSVEQVGRYKVFKQNARNGWATLRNASPELDALYHKKATLESTISEYRSQLARTSDRVGQDVSMLHNTMNEARRKVINESYKTIRNLYNKYKDDAVNFIADYIGEKLNNQTNNNTTNLSESEQIALKYAIDVLGLTKSHNRNLFEDIKELLKDEDAVQASQIVQNGTNQNPSQPSNNQNQVNPTPQIQNPNTQAPTQPQSQPQGNNQPQQPIQQPSNSTPNSIISSKEGTSIVGASNQKQGYIKNKNGLWIPTCVSNRVAYVLQDGTKMHSKGDLRSPEYFINNYVVAAHDGAGGTVEFSPDNVVAITYFDGNKTVDITQQIQDEANKELQNINNVNQQIFYQRPANATPITPEVEQNLNGKNPIGFINMNQNGVSTLPNKDNNRNVAVYDNGDDTYSLDFIGDKKAINDPAVFGNLDEVDILRPYAIAEMPIAEKDATGRFTILQKGRLINTDVVNEEVQNNSTQNNQQASQENVVQQPNNSSTGEGNQSNIPSQNSPITTNIPEELFSSQATMLDTIEMESLSKLQQIIKTSGNLDTDVDTLGQQYINEYVANGVDRSLAEQGVNEALRLIKRRIEKLKAKKSNNTMESSVEELIFRQLEEQVTPTNNVAINNTIDAIADVFKQYTIEKGIDKINGKAYISLEDVLRYVNSVTNPKYSNWIYDGIVQYLSNEKIANKFVVIDENETKSEDFLDNINKSIQQRRNEQLENENIKVDIKSFIKENPDQKDNFYEALDELQPGDRLTAELNNTGTKFNIKDSKGRIVGTLSLPHINPTTGAYEVYNDGWKTDIIIDNNNIKSKLKDKFKEWFVNPIGSAKELNNIILEFTYGKPSEERKQELLQQFKDNNAVKESKRLGYTQENVDDKKLINGLVKLMRHQKNLGMATDEFTQDLSIDAWFKELNTSYSGAMLLANNGSLDITVGKISEGELIRIVDHNKFESQQKAKPVKEAIAGGAKADVNKISIAVDNNGTIIASGIKNITARQMSPGSTFVTIPNRSGDPGLVHAFPAGVSDSYIGQDAKDIKNAIQDELIKLVKQFGFNPSNKNFNELKEFANAVIGSKDGNSSLLFGLYSTITDDEVSFFIGNSQIKISIFKNKFYDKTKFSNELMVGGPGFSNTRNNKPTSNISITSKEGRAIWKKHLRMILNNATFNLLENYIRSDNDNTINLKGLATREDGKFVIRVGDKKWTYDSYNDFIINNNLVRLNTQPSADGKSNYNRAAQRVQAGNQIFEIKIVRDLDETSSPVKESIETKPTNQPTTGVSLNDKVKSILESNSTNKGEEIVESLIGTDPAFTEKSLKVFKDLDLLPKNIIFDPEYNNQESKKTSNAKSTKSTGEVVVGTKWLNEFTSGDRNRAIRILIHEQLHLKLGEKPGFIDSIIPIYNEFVQAVKDGKVDELASRFGTNRTHFEQFFFNDKKTNEERIEEFLVESLTNYDLVSALNEIDADVTKKRGRRNLFQRILEKLAEIFGWDVKKGSLYEKELHTLRNLMTKLDERSKKVKEEKELRKANSKFKDINDRYKEVYEEVKDSPEALEILKEIKNGIEPKDIYEAASIAISRNKLIWKDEGNRKGVSSETGFGEGERRKVLGMIATREKGGKTIQELAEDEMQEICASYGIPYDNQEARNAIIDIIQTSSTISDINRYIENNRFEKALELKRKQDEYYESLEEEAKYYESLNQQESINQNEPITNDNYIGNNFDDFDDLDSLRRFDRESTTNELTATYTPEMNSIKQQAIANETFMKAPNGNPTNLNERQWLQVRTKNFINWFGDWINNPSEASKVVDENGEPLVVYHGGRAKFNTFELNNKEISKHELSKSIKPAIFFSDDSETMDFFAVTEKQSYAKQISRLIDIALDSGQNDYDSVMADIAKEINKSVEWTKNFWENEVPDDYKMYGEGQLMYDPEVENQKYRCFLNMKNPIIIDAKGERADKFIRKNKDILNSNDNIIIKNINETVSRKRTITDYILRNPNNIKSATNNTGDFSTTNDDIRYSTAIEIGRNIPSVQAMQDRLPLSEQANFASLVENGVISTSCK